MLFFLGGLLSAVKEVWHYVTSAVKSDIPSQVASSIIRPITDVLSEKGFDASYGLYEEAVAVWQKIHSIPDEHTISTQFAVDTPFDWRREHIMKMRIQGKDLVTGEMVDTWITVESNRPLSKREWQQMGQEAVIDSPFGYSYQVDYVAEYEYYTKGLI